MKKILPILLTLMLLLSSQAALAEGVVILESPDQPQGAAGSLDDLKVGVEVDLGDRIYTPKKAEITDSFDGGDWWNSGDEEQYVCLWLEALNLATKEAQYFSDAKVVLVYEGARGTYKFGGFVRQSYPSAEYSFSAAYAQSEMQSVGVLRRQNYLFACLIPNFVEENPGEIRLEIETDGSVMTCVIRK